MVYILLKMYFDLLLQKEENGKINSFQGIAGGAIAGLVSSLTGLGGGVIIIPLLTMRFKLSLLKAKTISLAMIFISTFTVSINNLMIMSPINSEDIDTIGYIVPSFILPISLGVFLGSPLGVRWSNILKRRQLDILFMTFVFLVLLEKFYELIFKT